MLTEKHLTAPKKGCRTTPSLACPIQIDPQLSSLADGWGSRRSARLEDFVRCGRQRRTLDPDQQLFGVATGIYARLRARGELQAARAQNAQQSSRRAAERASSRMAAMPA